MSLDKPCNCQSRIKYNFVKTLGNKCRVAKKQFEQSLLQILLKNKQTSQRKLKVVQKNSGKTTAQTKSADKLGLVNELEQKAAAQKMKHYLQCSNDIQRKRNQLLESRQQNQKKLISVNKQKQLKIKSRLNQIKQQLNSNLQRKLFKHQWRKQLVQICIKKKTNRLVRFSQRNHLQLAKKLSQQKVNHFIDRTAIKIQTSFSLPKREAILKQKSLKFNKTETEKISRTQKKKSQLEGNFIKSAASCFYGRLDKFNKSKSKQLQFKSRTVNLRKSCKRQTQLRHQRNLEQDYLNRTSKMDMLLSKITKRNSYDNSKCQRLKTSLQFEKRDIQSKIEQLNHIMSRLKTCENGKVYQAQSRKAATLAKDLFGSELRQEQAICHPQSRSNEELIKSLLSTKGSNFVGR